MPAQGDLHEARVAVAEGYVSCVWGEEGSNGCQAAMCSRSFWPILNRVCDGTVAIWALCVCDVSSPRGALMSDAKMGRKFDRRGGGTLV